MPVLEKSGGGRHDNWRHAPFVLRCRDGHCSHGGNSAKISVLVVRGKPLGYNMLLGIDAIRALGGVAVWPSGQIRIGGGLVPKCAAITINKPDFTVTFDQQSRAWIAA